MAIILRTLSSWSNPSGGSLRLSDVRRGKTCTFDVSECPASIESFLVTRSFFDDRSSLTLKAFGGPLSLLAN